MNLDFNTELADRYKSKSQIARILTEDWVLNNSYCPNCGTSKLHSYETNNPAADFFCQDCKSDYELKSSLTSLTNRVVDGAYETMINKIKDYSNPHFFFLNYTIDYTVNNFFCIPKHFFVPNIIERRKPLNANARRAGWVGCNILIKDLPSSGKVFLIRNKIAIDPKYVVRQWRKTSFLEKEELKSRGWLLELISIIDKIPKNSFSLSEVYSYESVLKARYPSNRFIKEKIRQQLQVLRDNGFLQFMGNGLYKKK